MSTRLWTHNLVYLFLSWSFLAPSLYVTHSHHTPLYIAHTHTTSISRRPDSLSVCLGWNHCCSHSPLSVLVPRELQVHSLCCCAVGAPLVSAQAPPQIGLTCCRSVLIGTVCCPPLPLFVSLAPGLQAFAPCCHCAIVASLIPHGLQTN